MERLRQLIDKLEEVRNIMADEELTYEFEKKYGDIVDMYEGLIETIINHVRQL